MSTDRRWCAIESVIDAYVADYLMECDDGSYSPSDSERFVIYDAILGLMAEPEFIAALPQPAVPEGCTPADARVLREANHALTIENHALREALANLTRGN